MKCQEAAEKLHNEELHKLCSSPSIIRIIASRIMEWEGHVARMVVKRIILKLILEKHDGWYGVDSSGLE
jgi:hypothetical protein